MSFCSSVSSKSIVEQRLALLRDRWKRELEGRSPSNVNVSVSRQANARVRGHGRARGSLEEVRQERRHDAAGEEEGNHEKRPEEPRWNAVARRLRNGGGRRSGVAVGH